MEDSPIDKDLSCNEIRLKKTLGEGADIVYRSLVIPSFSNVKALLVFIDGLVNTNEIDDTILAPLISFSQLPDQKELINNEGLLNGLIDAGVFASSVKATNKWNDACDSLVSGDSVLFVDGMENAFIFATRGFESRSVTEPATEVEVRGPRDGFIESLRTNTTLIRRRIRDYGLRFDMMRIGYRTKTDIAVAYIDSLVDKRVLGELMSRLQKINVDSILESGYIEEFIEDSPLSPFPQVEHTERPDKASAAILSGRIVIIVDNTPFVLIVPTSFWSLFQGSGDYYERFYIGTSIRLIRILAMILSITSSSVYVLLSSFNQEMLPTPLALKMAAGREGIPFPAVLEVLIMELMFEVLREAGIRIPKPIGQAVSIVGALVIGDAAVNAGLVSPTAVIVVAITGISSFVMPAYNLAISFRLLRFPLVIFTGMFGMLGFLGGTIAITLHLLSLRSFGAPFLAPVMPFRIDENKDVAVRAPWWKMTRRPKLAHSSETIRQSENQMPKPPSKDEDGFDE